MVWRGHSTCAVAGFEEGPRQACQIKIHLETAFISTSSSSKLMWPSAPHNFKVTVRKVMKHVCGWIWGVNECSYWHAYTASLCFDNLSLLEKKSCSHSLMVSISKSNSLEYNPSFTTCKSSVSEWCQWLIWFQIFLSPGPVLVPSWYPAATFHMVPSIYLELSELLTLVVSCSIWLSAPSVFGPSPTVSQVLLSGCGCLYLHVTTSHCYFLKLTSQSLHTFLLFY